ncbi:F0F1 ATP synthase subunit A [Microseira wollei]|uniref:ATP synthase subunit a n=1 Tax=Microseira wollei NIES-4236 TaxID=2530354 RepID=A0AAV3XNC8_9CYAN|nr:F0F1 ATP synthase subunit A [Microseira wollei]GET43400.1 ATP synthase F0, A subunit [Microseira wollei NIES-4236]
MHISTDEITIWGVNATLLFTWAIMALLGIGSWLVTRKLSEETHMSRWQNLLEVLVEGLENQIREISGQKPTLYLPFVGTLFIFIAVSNCLAIVPGYHPPTGSLSTTAALAICVFFAVPFYGIRKQGLIGYLKEYIQPSPIMLPFHIIGELSRTLSLAVRLFGNMMSDAMIVGILLSIAPLFFPIIMQAIGLLTGLIQAYIFAILAMVYIASATQAQQETVKNPSKSEEVLNG